MSTTLNTIELPVIQPSGDAPPTDPRQLTIALVGNPNAGKTSLFNRLTGLRAKTANFPGTTVERRQAPLAIGGSSATLVDLPGLYSLEPSTPDEQVACDALAGRLHGAAAPDLVVMVLDATNLERNLFLAGQVLELGRPTVAALNLSDVAERKGIKFDLDQLRGRLGCPVSLVSRALAEASTS